MSSSEKTPLSPVWPPERPTLPEVVSVPTAWWAPSDDSSAGADLVSHDWTKQLGLTVILGRRSSGRSTWLHTERKARQEESPVESFYRPSHRLLLQEPQLWISRDPIFLDDLDGIHERDLATWLDRLRRPVLATTQSYDVVAELACRQDRQETLKRLRCSVRLPAMVRHRKTEIDLHTDYGFSVLTHQQCEEILGVWSALEASRLPVVLRHLGYWLVAGCTPRRGVQWGACPIWKKT